MNKLLALLVVCGTLLFPATVQAHDLNQADIQAIAAMGYRSWALAHNQAAPNDPVLPCLGPPSQYDGRLPIAWYCTPDEWNALAYAPPPPSMPTTSPVVIVAPDPRAACMAAANDAAQHGSIVAGSAYNCAGLS